jgi:hypothetical protein
MRMLFVLCLMASAVAVTTPMVTDAEIVQVDALLARVEATAIPTEVVVKMTPRPTPTPAPTAKPADALIFAPKHAVPKVPIETPATTAKPTTAPTPSAKPMTTATPAAKATPNATPKPTAKPTTSPGGTTYTRDQVIAGIRAAWAGNDDKAVAVADCESALNPRATSPGGTYLGLWQFHIETWRNYGGSGDPRDHSPKTQTQVAWNVYLDHGWDAWPGCA